MISIDYSIYDPGRYVPDLAAALRRGAIDFESISDMIGAQGHQRILEIGCGCGSLLLAFGQRGYSDCLGLDQDERLVTHGRNVLGVNAVVGEWRTFLEQSELMFDIIIALDVLEHIEPSEISAVLSLTRSRLAPGGRLILRIPNALCPFSLPILYGDPTHRFLVVPLTLKYWLESASFSNVRIRETRPSGTVKRAFFTLLHLAIVKPLISLVHYHFHGEFPSHVTPNIICCAFAQHP